MWRNRIAADGGEYPRIVAVETTSRCNASCSFCAYNIKATEKAQMNEDLFRKIIDDCRAFPLEQIEPFLNGDPFVDPMIIERIDHIRRCLPSVEVGLYSNGYALSPKRIDELISVGGVHSLTISLNTLDPERYHSIMGLKLKRTLDNLSYLTDPVRKKRVAKKLTVRMVRMDDTTLDEQNVFLDYCKKLDVRPFIVGQFNYKGDIPVSDPLPVPSYPCEHITRLDILSNGTVPLCCQDPDARYSWGNVRDHSVLEVFRGSVASHYREQQRKGKRLELEPCKDCNLFWPSLGNMSFPQRAKFSVQAGLYFAKYRPSRRKGPRKRGL